MSEHISIQQKIQRYRQLNPNLKDLSDEQILSIMSKNGEISLTKEQKISLYSSKTNTSNNHRGVEIEKQTDTKTIILRSGQKIVISSGIPKYYSADGKELNQKDFEQHVGIIDVRNSGRYSITKNGKTRYYAFNGTELNEAYFKQVENTDVIVAASDGKRYNFNKTLEKRINNVSTNLKKAEDENGFIGSTWSGIKNITGIGDSSDNVREQQEIEKKLLEQFNTTDQNRTKVFKELTGFDYTEENLEKFIKGEIKLKSEIALNGYKDGQAMAVDVGADIVSGVAAVGIYTAAVAAAPFTGGGSIAVGIAAAGASGAAIKTGMKAADAATGGREYSLKDAAHDAATGTFSGVIAPVTGGLGGAVGKTVATKLGVQAVKQVGKEVAESAVESGVKQTIKTALTNPTGYEYVGGNIAKKSMALGAEMATDGALGGSVDNAFRTAIDGGSIEDVAQAAGEGFVGGAILSPVIGGGMKSVGKGAQKIFGKDNVHIDTNGIEIKQNGSDNIRQLSREELKQKLKAANKLEPDSKEIHISKGKMAAPSAKFAATKEAYIDMLYDYAYDFSYLNANIKDKTILAKAINAIGNEGMDFTGIEHPFRIDNSMDDRGLTDFGGTSEVVIKTTPMKGVDAFKNDVANLSHRIFHEKRHVYQNIQRSVGFGADGLEPLELYASDLAGGSANKDGATQTEYYNYLKNNQYDYNVAKDGRFPRNVREEDIDYGMAVSENQANYIDSMEPGYWTQFVEKDAEDIGMLCGNVVENIIRDVPPDITKISPIAKAAKYAQDNNIDFDDAYNVIKNSNSNVTRAQQSQNIRKLDPIEQLAMNKIAEKIKERYPNVSLEDMQAIIDDAIILLDDPKYSNMHYLDFVDKVVQMYT